MMNSTLKHAFLSITLSAFAAGCTVNSTDGGAPPNSVELGTVVEDYKEASNITYKDCGQVSVACYPMSSTGMVQTCLIDAFSSCTPAQARIDVATIEGGPITDVFIVAPDGKGGCKIEDFVDTTHDNYGIQKLIRNECQKVSSSNCGMLAGESCSSVEEY